METVAVFHPELWVFGLSKGNPFPAFLRPVALILVATLPHELEELGVIDELVTRFKGRNLSIVVAELVVPPVDVNQIFLMVK